MNPQFVFTLMASSVFGCVGLWAGWKFNTHARHLRKARKAGQWTTVSADEKAGMVYVAFSGRSRKRVRRTSLIDPQVALDYGDDNMLLGVEVHADHNIVLTRGLPK